MGSRLKPNSGRDLGACCSELTDAHTTLCKIATISNSLAIVRLQSAHRDNTAQQQSSPNEKNVKRCKDVDGIHSLATGRAEDVFNSPTRVPPVHHVCGASRSAKTEVRLLLSSTSSSLQSFARYSIMPCRRTGCGFAIGHLGMIAYPKPLEIHP